MRTLLRQRWLLSLIGPTLLVGCHLGETRQAAPQRPCSCSANTTAQPATLALLTQPAHGGTTTATLVTYGTAEPAKAPAEVAGGGANQAAIEQASHVTKQPGVAATPVTQAPVTVTSGTMAVASSPDLPPAKSLYPRREPAPTRKSFSDITAHSSFGHAGDYSWISGAATKYRNEWRVRYASVDESDAHGGSLVLIGDEQQLDKLRDGEYFKLVGHIEPHSSKTGGEAFQVHSVERAN
jgi:hypothetical protein